MRTKIRLRSTRLRRLIPRRVQARARGLRRQWILNRNVEQIVRAGALDREWYECQLGRTFASDRMACRHYLEEGRRSGFSPHPLFEPSEVDSRTWSRALVDPLVRNLQRRSPRHVRVHALLPPSLTHSADTASTDPALPQWLAWARAAESTTALPQAPRVPEPLAWGAVRAAEMAAAALWRDGWQRVNVPRITEDAPSPVPAVPESLWRGEHPVVSVILPTWNRAHSLRAAVASVLAQTWPDVQLIVVDDGSTDDTPSVLEGLRRRDKRIQIVRTEHVGVCAARNAGLAAVRGSYVAFLDSDNTWHPTFLSAMLSAMRAEDLAVAHAELEVIVAGQAPRYRAFAGSYEHLLLANYIDLNVLVVRKDLMDLVGGFDETLRRSVDYDLVLRLARVAPMHLVRTVGATYSDSDDDVLRISRNEPLAWNSVVRNKHLVLTDTAPASLTAGRVSVVIPVRSHLDLTAEVVQGLLEEAGDIEVVLAAAGCARAFLCQIAGRFAQEPRVRMAFWPSDLGIPVATNLGAWLATGEHLVFWRPGWLLERGTLSALVEALRAGPWAVVQPLMVKRIGTVFSAGALFPPRDVIPSAFLENLTVEDAQRLGVHEVPAVMGGVAAMRMVDFRALGGLDPLLGNDLAEVDISLRAAREGLGGSAVVASHQVSAPPAAAIGFAVDRAASARVFRSRASSFAPLPQATWEETDLTVVAWKQRFLDKPGESGSSPRTTAAVPVLARRAQARVIEAPPSLRWSLDIAAPAGPRGRLWGDWHFARSLAAALRRRGQFAHVDVRAARSQAHRDLDDVTLVLRGLDKPVLRPTNLSLMWVISHPELVTADECAAFDAVFAASLSWSADQSTKWRLPIEPLLQCTDAQLFRPDTAAPDNGEDVVFVGNSRGILRSAVRSAVTAGIDVAVYGTGWDGLIDEGLVRAEYVPNGALSALYRSSGIVLNDHWDDMRLDGFISNRVFDVLASGGRLLTDRVAGLEGMFGDDIRFFASEIDLAQILAGDWRSRFPSEEERTKTAQHVREEHSFDARADRLVERACQLLQQ